KKDLLRGMPLAGRIGIEWDDVVVRHAAGQRLDVEGNAKQVAARLMSACEPGQTLLTKEAADHAAKSMQHDSEVPATLRWVTHGQYWLQGLNRMVTVCEAGLPNLSPFNKPAGNSKVGP